MSKVISATLLNNITSVFHSLEHLPYKYHLGEGNIYHMVPLGFISVQSNQTSPSHLKAE